MVAGSTLGRGTMRRVHPDFAATTTSPINTAESSRAVPVARKPLPLPKDNFTPARVSARLQASISPLTPSPSALPHPPTTIVSPLPLTPPSQATSASGKASRTATAPPTTRCALADQLAAAAIRRAPDLADHPAFKNISAHKPVVHTGPWPGSASLTPLVGTITSSSATTSPNASASTTATTTPATSANTTPEKQEGMKTESAPVPIPINLKRKPVPTLSNATQTTADPIAIAASRAAALRIKRKTIPRPISVLAPLPTIRPRNARAYGGAGSGLSSSGLRSGKSSAAGPGSASAGARNGSGRSGSGSGMHSATTPWTAKYGETPSLRTRGARSVTSSRSGSGSATPQTSTSIRSALRAWTFKSPTLTLHAQRQDGDTDIGPPVPPKDSPNHWEKGEWELAKEYYQKLKVDRFEKKRREAIRVALEERASVEAGRGRVDAGAGAIANANANADAGDDPHRPGTSGGNSDKPKTPLSARFRTFFHSGARTPNDNTNANPNVNPNTHRPGTSGGSTNKPKTPLSARFRSFFHAGPRAPNDPTTTTTSNPPSPSALRREALKAAITHPSTRGPGVAPARVFDADAFDLELVRQREEERLRRETIHLPGVLVPGRLAAREGAPDMLAQYRERRERMERTERKEKRITTVGEMMDAFAPEAMEKREKLIQERILGMGLPLERPGTGASNASNATVSVNGSVNGSTTSTATKYNIKAKGKGKEKAKAVLAKVQQTLAPRRGSDDSDTSFWACDGSAEDLYAPVATAPKSTAARCGVCGVSIPSGSTQDQAQGVLLCAGCAHGVDGYENNLPMRADSLRPATSPLAAPPPPPPPPAMWMQAEPARGRANRSSSFYSVRPGVQPMTYEASGRLVNPYASPYDNGVNLSELTVFNEEGWLETGSLADGQRREQEHQPGVADEGGRAGGRDTGFYRFYDELLVSPVSR